MNNSLHYYRTVFIVGPTASGKSSLALELAQKMSAQIICADSQTVRRSMDIGTAKPTSAEQKSVKHHLISIVDPYEEYNLAMFLKSARVIINRLHQKNIPVIVVGGTGLYIDGLYFDYSLPELSSKSVQIGDFEKLSIQDLQAEITNRGYNLPLNTKNRRHLINILKRNGEAGSLKSPEKRTLIVGLYPGREKLISRIDSRVDLMFESGFIDEVKNIIDRYGNPPKEFDAIGYKIVFRHLSGEITEAEAKELLKVAHRQYAKKQMTWFKRNPHIVWKQDANDAAQYVMSMFNTHP